MTSVYPPRPPGRLRRNLVVVIVLVTFAVVGIGYYAIVIYPQPNITLTDATYQQSGCGVFGPNDWTYSWTFSLVNTGNAAGFAKIEFYLNGITYGYNVYFVGQGTQVTKGGSVSSPDCGTYSPSLAITGVTKA